MSANIFTSLNLLVLQLGIDGDVNRFLVQDNPFSDPKAISDISNLSNAIKAYTATNNYFDLVNIYSQKSGTIIGTDTTVIRLQQYYDNLFSIEGMTYDQWLNSFLNKRYENELIYDLDITIRNNKSKYFVYANTIPTFDETNIANIFVFCGT